MLTIQLKVACGANPLKTLKGIDFRLKINSYLRVPPRGLNISFLLKSEKRSPVAKTRVSASL